MHDQKKRGGGINLQILGFGASRNKYSLFMFFVEFRIIFQNESVLVYTECLSVEYFTFSRRQGKFISKIEYSIRSVFIIFWLNFEEKEK